MSPQEFIEKLRKLGIGPLYHVTDKDNLISIVKERGLFSWKRAQEDDIVVSRPGGTPINHRLDSRIGRDGYVHLYPFPPGEGLLKRFSLQGRFGELFPLEVSEKALKEGRTVFWLGGQSNGGERIDDVEVLSERLQSDPKLIESLTVDVQDSIHRNYLLNIPADIESRISEVHPTAIVFVVDQSLSMARSTEIDNVQYDSIAEYAAETINTLIEHFLKRCIGPQGEVNRLYDIAVVGYGEGVNNAWNGELHDSYFHTPVELMAHPQASEEKFIWVDPKDDDSKGRADLALEFTLDLISSWVNKKENRLSYPPTVIHISDGQVSTLYQKGFLKASENLKRLSTETGNTILWNIGISPFRTREYKLLSGEDLPALFHHGTDSTVLYEASSYLPERFKKTAAAIHLGDDELERRTMVVNLPEEKLVRLLQMCVLPE